jgi:crotonobetainyl-CoA:carnitine CoA-transferase CaiB-like acyl-CoA transferase
MADRVAHREEMDGLVQEWVGRHEARSVLRILDEAEVPASLVYSVKDLFEDPHLKARENIVSLVEPLLGMLHMPGVVPKLSKTPGRIVSTGPRQPGEHNEEIYLGRLGLSKEQLLVLKTQGIV